MGCCSSKIPFREPLGKHNVSIYEVRLPVSPRYGDKEGIDSGSGSVGCMFFYPTDPNFNQEREGGGSGGGGTSTQSVKRQYFRDKIIDNGILAGQGSLKYACCLGYRMQHEHPCAVESKLLLRSHHSENGWPLAVFSHGLFGCKEMYTSFCRNLASSGMIVVSVEHEDGSACFCETHDGITLRYQSPPDSINYSNREEVIEFRAPFLDKRALEVECVLDALGVLTVPNKQEYAAGFKLPPPPPVGESTSSSDSSSSSSSSSKSILLLESIKKAIDINNIHLCGHSFGGATIIHSTQKLETRLQDRLKTRVLLDTWPYPLSSEVCSREYKVRSLFLASEDFIKGTEISLTKEIAKKGPHQFGYIEGSVHQQFSDTPLWFPTSIGKIVNTTGSCDRHQAFAALHESVMSFIEDSNNPCNHILLKWGYDLYDKDIVKK